LDIPFIMIVHTQINSVLDVDSIISISWTIDHHFNLDYRSFYCNWFSRTLVHIIGFIALEINTNVIITCWYRPD